MKKLIALIIMMTAGIVLAGTRIETDNMDFRGQVTVSNVTANGISKLSTNAPAYDDMLGPARIITVGGANITWDTALAGASFDTGCTTNSNSDNLVFTYQTPHKRLTNSHLDPHVHWYQNNADQTNLWYIRYSIMTLGETNITDIFAGPATNQLNYSGVNMHQLSTFPAINGTGKGISSILRIKLFRYGSRGTGNITVTDLDCHIEIDSLGSDQELSKSY